MLLRSPVKLSRRCGVDVFTHWFLLPLAGVAWTLSASERWAAAQRTIRPWASGRVNAAVIMLSQGAMAIFFFFFFFFFFKKKKKIFFSRHCLPPTPALTAQRHGPLRHRHPRSSPEPGLLDPPLCPTGNG